MTRSCRRKKSDPSIGLATSAKQKGCRTRNPENLRSISADPNVRIAEPLAANNPRRSGLEVSEAGKTETSAPVSTKNAFCDSSSHTESVPGGADEMALM